MKIDNKIFSLPPYISTTWGNIQTLCMKGTSLIISLNDGESILIPDIKSDLIETIFDAHTAFLESNEKKTDPQPKKPSPFPFPFNQAENGQVEFPFKFGMGSLENLNNAIQHNPEQANHPDLPEEILGKIRSIAKIIIPEEALDGAPKAEPHCNCMYCQIARALNEGLGIADIYQREQEIEIKTETMEDVSDNDLQFQQWDIEQKNDQLYTVTSRLDHEEQYNVFLGTPVGCTCGKEGCDHILAVLKS